MADYIKGVDVSEIQRNNINWQQVANLDIKFGIAKCYQGNDGRDPCYSTNIAGMKAAGILPLAYHFVYPLNTDPVHPHRDPVSQAQLHFAAAEGVRACCDLEWPTENDWNAWGINAEFINQWCLAYLAEYSRLDGRPMIIYTYPDFAKVVKLSAEYAQYPLWIASYEATPEVPAPWTDWVIWQNSGGTDFHLPNGCPCDTDLAKDLSLWGTTATPPIVVEPVEPIIVEPTQPTPVATQIVPPAVAQPSQLKTVLASILKIVMELLERKI